MPWNVALSKKADKQASRLPVAVRAALLALMEDIAALGPVRGDWPNYSRLTDRRHHCHLKKGKPTYVAVWTEERETVSVEIIYAGTHEKAPY